ncbi:MAG: 2-hydroxyacyl-CoA dehydratase, partial [Alphaproteobacteria bacterium]|nr:2-hydroxyacyl-CoA dehydratase [Alphaproteobacteria bacterium]
MARAAFEPFERAYENSMQAIESLRASGRIVVRTLGLDAPRELILAAGLVPVRLVGSAAAPTPRADSIMGSATMGARGKRLLEQLVDPSVPDLPLLITQADSEQPQIFAALRELGRLGETVPSDIHFLDLLHIERASSRAYNIRRLEQLADWLQAISGQLPSLERLDAAKQSLSRQRLLLERLDRARIERRVSGSDTLRIIGASAVLPVEDHSIHLESLLGEVETLPPLAGKPIYVTGTAHESAALYASIESRGAIIVGEDHGWGSPFFRAEPTRDGIYGLADPALRPVSRTLSPPRRADDMALDVARSGAELVLHLSLDGDEAAPWDIASAKSALRPNIRFLALRTGLQGDDAFCTRIDAFLRGEPSVPEGPARGSPGSGAPKPAARPAARSRKSLESVAAFGAYQREWFARIRSEVANGAPFAMTNANAPQEILRALDVPFVVNQWWASIVAAKQQSRRYLGLLAEHGYPKDVEAYSSQGLAAVFDEDSELAPWGGLPKPDFLFAIASSDPTIKIFDYWAREA